MASRFQGRDYSTLRSEIIEFLRQRLPTDWDYTNLADPVVIFAESLARVGDQLHFTIDELRRECDIATANRASSVYSYAMREGYKMMLPKGSSGTITINSSDTQSNMLHLQISKFDEIQVLTTGDVLYAANDIDADLQKIPTESYIDQISNISPNEHSKYVSYIEYANNMYRQTQRLNVVLGKKGEYNFSYGDINNDSTVTLPDPLIDRNLIRLTVTDGTATEWKYVDDIIGAGFVGNIYTLTTKFIGGVIVLCIEFATNYRDLFSETATFKFEYITISNNMIENNADNNAAIDLSDYIEINSGYEDAEDIQENGIQYIVNLGTGIKGYTEYEDPNVTRENYKKFIQSYSSLLTKDDFANYIKAITATYCKVYDHSDNYKDNVLPENTALMERVIYILTEALYDERESLWRDLTERTSRSDCVVLMPYGKDPYTIVVKAECFLLGTSVSDIATKIKAQLMSYFSGSIGEKIPTASMIDYLVHKASDKVVRTYSVTVRDSQFGTINSDFNDVSTLSNDDIDNLFVSIQQNDIYSEMGKRYLMGIYTRPAYSDYPDTFPNYIVNDADFEANFNEAYTNHLFGEAPWSNIYFYDPNHTGEFAPYIQYSDYVENEFDTYAKFVYTNDPTFSTQEDPKSAWEDFVNDSSHHTFDPRNENYTYCYKAYCKDYAVNAHVYYDKYLTVEYNQFPDAFPGIYKVSGEQETLISDYNALVKTQTVYGTIDSRTWDIDDSEIFIFDHAFDNINYSGDDLRMNHIDPYYIKHHYMTPVLNRVVVLIKAIGN